jgi:hypothetical protein
MEEQSKTKRFKATFLNLYQNKIVTKSPIHFVVWRYLVDNAMYKDEYARFRGKVITLYEGEIIIKLKQLTEICQKGITKKQVRDALNDFKKADMIKTERGNEGLLITLVNYKKYNNKSITKRRTYKPPQTPKAESDTNTRADSNANKKPETNPKAYRGTKMDKGTLQSKEYDDVDSNEEMYLANTTPQDVEATIKAMEAEAMEAEAGEGEEEAKGSSV